MLLYLPGWLIGKATPPCPSTNGAAWQSRNAGRPATTNSHDRQLQHRKALQSHRWPRCSFSFLMSTAGLADSIETLTSPSSSLLTIGPPSFSAITAMSGTRRLTAHVFRIPDCSGCLHLAVEHNLRIKVLGLQFVGSDADGSAISSSDLLRMVVPVCLKALIRLSR